MTTTLIHHRRAAKRPGVRDIRRMSLEELYELAEQLNGQPVPNLRMSETEFETWCDEDLKAEWVDGKVVLMSSVNVDHDECNTWLVTLLRMFVEEYELGAVYSNIFVRLAAQRRRRVPDLLFISTERLHLLKPTYLDGAPDLIIEIVSPDSQSRDRREKFQEYEKAGVREYWITDPLSRTVEVYRLEKKKFVLIEENDGVVTSFVLPKFKLKTSMLWQKPLPKVAGVLRQLNIKS